MSNDELRLKLRQRASRNLQSVKVLRATAAAVPLGDVGWDGDGGPLHLARQAVAFMIRERRCGSVDGNGKLATDLPDVELFEIVDLAAIRHGSPRCPFPVPRSQPFV